MNTFDIAIYAIAAIALILVFFTLILPFFSPGNNLTTIKNGVENAKINQNLGKTFALGALRYSKDATITTNDFDTTKMLVNIECTNPKECCQQKTSTNEKCTKTVCINCFQMGQARN